jgi:lipopolysaccharide biosynthesis regulator YciM
MTLESLLFLLLPLAAFSGWLVGIRRKRHGKSQKGDCVTLSQDYFKGLNYLLDEQADKALEVFIHMSELDSETVELHFALANLFARRGEVDRAIRIHQNLIARPVLAQKDRNRALYELAQDYMRAGLLDRAENLFGELMDDAIFGQRCRRQLLDVYQQEKEWEKAIAIARRLDSVKGQARAPILAHFFCEQAEEALAKGDSSQALRMVKRAFNEERNSVRASLLEARLQLLSNNARGAIKSLQRVGRQNGEYLPLILEPLQQAYAMQDDSAGFIEYLQQLPDGMSHTSVLKLSEQIQAQGGEAEALQFLSQALRRRPSLRILQQMLHVYAKQAGENSELQLALKTLDEFLQDKALYHCENCGFHSRAMQWQCPSCKQWGRVKPIHGIEGD